MLSQGTAHEASTASRLQTLLNHRTQALRRQIIDEEGQKEDNNAEEKNQSLLEETASLESTGEEIDTFHVDRDRCRLAFEPNLGDILPGRCAKITVRHSAAGKRGNPR